MATATKAKKTTALAKPKKEDFLADLRTMAEKNGKQLDQFGFGDILKKLEADNEIISAAALGNGWAVLNNKEKARLCGVPMLILSWVIRDGDNGEYVSLQVLTNTERLIVNDGSTGIFNQIQEISKNGELRAIYCKHGLRESKYEYEDPKTGEKKPASTFYIDTSA